jgi:hypothetical protein
VLRVAELQEVMMMQQQQQEHHIKLGTWEKQQQQSLAEGSPSRGSCAGINRGEAGTGQTATIINCHQLNL